MAGEVNRERNARDNPDAGPQYFIVSGEGRLKKLPEVKVVNDTLEGNPPKPLEPGLKVYQTEEVTEEDFSGKEGSLVEKRGGNTFLLRVGYTPEALGDDLERMYPKYFMKDVVDEPGEKPTILSDEELLNKWLCILFKGVLNNPSECRDEVERISGNVSKLDETGGRDIISTDRKRFSCHEIARLSLMSVWGSVDVSDDELSESRSRVKVGQLLSNAEGYLRLGHYDGDAREVGRLEGLSPELFKLIRKYKPGLNGLVERGEVSDKVLKAFTDCSQMLIPFSPDLGGCSLEDIDWGLESLPGDDIVNRIRISLMRVCVHVSQGLSQGAPLDELAVDAGNLLNQICYSTNLNLKAIEDMRERPIELVKLISLFSS